MSVKLVKLDRSKKENETYSSLFTDRRTEELYNKYAKYAENRNFWIPIKNKKDPKNYTQLQKIVSKDEFDKYISYLFEITNGRSKITYKKLHHILETTKYDDDLICDIMEITTYPFNFLTLETQLLSFNQIVMILDNVKNIKYDKKDLINAWINHYFISDARQLYIERWKLEKTAATFDWSKYNISIKEVYSLLIQIKHNNIYYYTTQYFVNIEKETGDKILNQFYEDIHIPEIEVNLDKKLTFLQKEAVKKAILNKLSLISGFPGTGKSTVIKSIVDYYANECIYCWLMAPTGKATKVLKEKCCRLKDNLCGTIHRFVYSIWPTLVKLTKRPDLNMLETEPGSIVESLKTLIMKGNFCKVFIVDESSMIDFNLFIKFIDIVIECNGKLILVGDKNQLPPVQFGRPFEYILKSNIFNYSTTFLTDIQRTDSLALSNKIKKSITDGLRMQDFDDKEIVFISQTSFTDQSLKTQLTNVLNRFGKECKLITPQHKAKDTSSDGGTIQCNKILQQILNPNSKEILNYFDVTFRDNDPIIQKENDYESNPPRVNGDTAVVVKKSDYTIIKGSKTIEHCIIQYDDSDKPEMIEIEDLKDQFEMFYCATVHKFQGSEHDTIILILSNKHAMWNMENNLRLFYTAISRAKKTCVVIGDPNVLNNLRINKKDSFYSKFMDEFNEYDF